MPQPCINLTNQSRVQPPASSQPCPLAKPQQRVTSRRKTPAPWRAACRPKMASCACVLRFTAPATRAVCAQATKTPLCNARLPTATGWGLRYTPLALAPPPRCRLSVVCFSEMWIIATGNDEIEEKCVEKHVDKKYFCKDIWWKSKENRHIISNFAIFKRHRLHTTLYMVLTYKSEHNIMTSFLKTQCDGMAPTLSVNAG